MAKLDKVGSKEMKYSLNDEQMDSLVASLLTHNFNISKACDSVGIPREAYYYMLKWSEKFSEKLKWSKSFLGNIITNGLLEGITHSDLTLRHKYLDLLAKSGILANVMGIEGTKSDVTFSFDKSQIKFS